MATSIAPAPAAPASGNKYFLQPEFDQELSEDESTISVTYKGEYDALSTFARTFAPGTSSYSGASTFLLSTLKLERTAGPTGLLTLLYTDSAPGSGSGSGGGSARVRSVSWRLSSNPADVSVYRYCGQSSSNANRVRIERWWTDPGDDPASSLYGLVDADQKIALKILAGKETVQRHYPVIVKTSVYSRGNITPTGQLDYYVTSIAGAPSWMIGRANAWLKIQEDCELAADKSQTLVEGWIGGESFDDNFYGSGASRWKFGTI